jgi:hypothetical protein
LQIKEPSENCTKQYTATTPTKREKGRENEYIYRYKASIIVILLGDLCPFMVQAGE